MPLSTISAALLKSALMTQQGKRALMPICNTLSHPVVSRRKLGPLTTIKAKVCIWTRVGS